MCCNLSCRDEESKGHSALRASAPKKDTPKCAQGELFALGESMRLVRLVPEVSALCVTCVQMIKNEPSSQLCALDIIDSRVRSSDHIALRSLPVVGSVIC